MNHLTLLHEVLPQAQIQRRYWVAQINSRPVQEQDRQQVGLVLQWVTLGVLVTGCLLVGGL